MRCNEFDAHIDEMLSGILHPDASRHMRQCERCTSHYRARATVQRRTAPVSLGLGCGAVARRRSRGDGSIQAAAAARHRRNGPGVGGGCAGGAPVHVPWPQHGSGVGLAHLVERRRCRGGPRGRAGLDRASLELQPCGECAHPRLGSGLAAERCLAGAPSGCDRQPGRAAGSATADAGRLCGCHAAIERLVDGCRWVRSSLACGARGKSGSRGGRRWLGLDL